eukprot:768370-Hanusia_phi.AAC.2
MERARHGKFDGIALVEFESTEVASQFVKLEISYEGKKLQKMMRGEYSEKKIDWNRIAEEESENGREDTDGEVENFLLAAKNEIQGIGDAPSIQQYVKLLSKGQADRAVVDLLHQLKTVNPFAAPTKQVEVYFPAVIFFQNIFQSFETSLRSQAVDLVIVGKYRCLTHPMNLARNCCAFLCARARQPRMTILQFLHTNCNDDDNVYACCWFASASPSWADVIVPSFLLILYLIDDAGARREIARRRCRKLHGLSSPCLEMVWQLKATEAAATLTFMKEPSDLHIEMKWTNPGKGLQTKGQWKTVGKQVLSLSIAAGNSERSQEFQIAYLDQDLLVLESEQFVVTGMIVARVSLIVCCTSLGAEPQESFLVLDRIKE